jgi:hypothetical protein
MFLKFDHSQFPVSSQRSFYTVSVTPFRDRTLVSHGPRISDVRSDLSQDIGLGLREKRVNKG